MSPVALKRQIKDLLFFTHFILPHGHTVNAVENFLDISITFPNHFDAAILADENHCELTRLNGIILFYANHASNQGVV
jgi:hypothetical protein